MKYQDNILQRFQTFRDSCTLCDVTLKTEEAQFQVHRVILSAASEYFRAMFTTSMKEKHQLHINMNELTPLAVDRSLHYIYCGYVKVDVKSVEEVLNAACFLQLWGLKTICANWMKENLNVLNCLEFLNLAKIYDDKKLEKYVWQFVEKHAEDVLKTSDFNYISMETIREILSSENLQIKEELQLYEMLIKWVQADYENRKFRFCQLFPLIRLPTLDVDCLLTILRTDKLVNSCDVCSLFAEKCLAHIQTGNVVLPTNLTNSRFHTNVLIVKRNLKRFQICDLKSNFIHDVENIPQLPIDSDCGSAVTLKNRIFVLGGLCSKSAFELNLNDDVKQWTKLPPMKHVHNLAGWSGAIEFQNNLLVIGGKDESNYSNKVEMFNVSSKSWSDLPDLNTARANMAIASNSTSIFVAGGKSSTRILSSVECYNHNEKNWAVLSPMNEPRLAATSVVSNEFLYVLGGWNRCVLSSCEVYNLATKCWSYISNLNHQRYIFGSALVEDKLYVFGGCRNEAFHNSEPASACEVWDPRSGEWVDYELGIMKDFCKLCTL